MMLCEEWTVGVKIVYRMGFTIKRGSHVKYSKLATTTKTVTK